MKNKLFKLALLTLGFNVFVLAACNSTNPELEKFLDKKEKQFEQISYELGDAYWNFYSGEAKADLKTPKDEFYNLLINDTLNNYIKEWYPKRAEIKDTILRRRIELWHRVLLSAKVEYDAEIMQLRNELEEALQVSDKKTKEPYDFETNMLKLIQLRNKKAVELGFDNYVHLTFEVNGLGYQWFKNFVIQMDSLSYNAYRSLVDKTKEEKNLEKFDQRNAYRLYAQFYRNTESRNVKEEEMIPLVKESLANIGINYSELPAKLVEKELPPGVGGQGLMINIPNDFRAAMTLGVEISTWMHEMGHGLHGLFNSIDEPILEGYEWIPGNANTTFAEGMAETSAWITRNPEWQKKYTNLTKEEIAKKRELVHESVPAYIRFSLYNFMIETELYLNPEKSYEEIQTYLAKKYLLIETEEIRTRGLNNIIYVSYPLYLQNYLLADMIASQVHTALNEKFGENYVFNKEVGPYLIKNFYSAGEYYNWNERLIQGTGKPLDIEAYFNYYDIK
ncbi:MAG: hypothetical protein KQH79_07125 [Bacteroidetes bacterium]|nr:hypothetical protein [Bacteroidota bacterium]